MLFEIYTKERFTMPKNITVLFVMEMIGTVAFSCSGAMLAIKKHLDLLGIIVLGVITACGGGMIRDVLIGNTPPNLFIHPIYVEVAIASAVIIFILIKTKKFASLFNANAFDWTMNILDAIGLGAFTVVGVDIASSTGYDHYQFLTIFLGVITGVGGGLLRDMMALEIPAILRKHIYACASLAGAILYIILLRCAIPSDISLVLCAAIVVIIRLLARQLEWNLPKCDFES